jgi:hypothetical protein
VDGLIKWSTNSRTNRYGRALIHGCIDAGNVRRTHLCINIGVAVCLRKANYRHKYVVLNSVVHVSIGGSANGGRIEKMFHC